MMKHAERDYIEESWYRTGTDRNQDFPEITGQNALFHDWRITAPTLSGALSGNNTSLRRVIYDWRSATITGQESKTVLGPFPNR
jgi:hypothetical protein